MGDRANIKMIYEDRKVVWFYGHWAGRQLPELLQKGLIKGKDRWDDDCYLARILFQTMLDGDDDTTGFGISPWITDNERPILAVDVANQQVRIENEEGDRLEDPCIGMVIGFEDYIKLEDIDWDMLNRMGPLSRDVLAA